MRGEQARWSWPNVRGKRCLSVGGTSLGVDDELAERGAADVVSCARLSDLGQPFEPFDVVVAVGALAQTALPSAGAAELAGATSAMLLSVEPLDLRSSVLRRGAPWVESSATTCAFNGAGHKQLLIDAGFAIERVGRPFAHGDVRPSPDQRWDDGPLRRLMLRALSGSWREGELHRALLARRRADAVRG